MTFLLLSLVVAVLAVAVTLVPVVVILLQDRRPAAAPAAPHRLDTRQPLSLAA